MKPSSTDSCVVHAIGASPAVEGILASAANW